MAHGLHRYPLTGGRFFRASLSQWRRSIETAKLPVSVATCRRCRRPGVWHGPSATAVTCVPDSSSFSTSRRSRPVLLMRSTPSTRICSSACPDGSTKQTSTHTRPGANESRSSPAAADGSHTLRRSPISVDASRRRSIPGRAPRLFRAAGRRLQTPVDDHRQIAELTMAPDYCRGIDVGQVFFRNGHRYCKEQLSSWRPRSCLAELEIRRPSHPAQSASCRPESRLAVTSPAPRCLNRKAATAGPGSSSVLDGIAISFHPLAHRTDRLQGSCRHLVQFARTEPSKLECRHRIESAVSMLTSSIMLISSKLFSSIA